jgi:hypothetical protein
MVVLFILPRVVSREYHVPESIASVLDTVSGLALLVLFVLAIRMIICMPSQFFSRTPRNSSG